MAVLIARYLGPKALGTYAVVMGLAQLFEIVAPLGQQYVIIRGVARDRSRLFIYWANASLVTIVSAIALGIIMISLTYLLRYDAEVLSSVFVVCFFLPIAGLYTIAQASLQGLERMEYLTISAFIGRVVGLLVLWVLLRSGTGVVAAFIGQGLFQLIALIILVWAMMRQGKQIEAIRELGFDLNLCRNNFHTSFPFAIQGFLTKALLRVNTLILPLFVTMATVGMFDAADRFRQTSVMIIPMVTMAIFPTLSRSFIDDHEKSVALMEKALKILLIIFFPFVFIVALGADQIIPILYGPGYEAAVPILRIVIWSQLFFVADAVFNQVMMASDNERPMVRRTGISLITNVLLTLALAPRFGIIGVAWAVILTRALNLGLDAHFVLRKVVQINIPDNVGKPLLCAVISGAIAFLFHGHGLYTILLINISSYIVLLAALKVFSQDEFLQLRQLLGHLWLR
jgi:O-antigen/teichoic acid export membrane protein